MGFLADGTQSTITQPDAQGEGMKSGKWGQAQLGFHKCIHQPTLQASALPFYRALFTTFPFTSLPYNCYGTFPGYSSASIGSPGQTGPSLLCTALTS
jgi:hypothetical protein